MILESFYSFIKEAKVNPYQQAQQWSCSAACLKTVLSHFGKDLSEEEAIELIGTKPGRGAEVTEVAEGARKVGFMAFDYCFSSLDQAKYLLDMDVPIICDIQSFNHPGKGHYVVLVSIDGDQVQLMDPNTPGNSRVISREEMDDRWWDYEMAPPHAIKEKWGVVVLPPEDHAETQEPTHPTTASSPSIQSGPGNSDGSISVSNPGPVSSSR